MDINQTLKLQEIDQFDRGVLQFFKNTLLIRMSKNVNELKEPQKIFQGFGIPTPYTNR